MAIVISTVNMKGGVGKTTLTVNLASALAKYAGKRVLVVDLDAQISATLSLMSPHDFAKIRKNRRTLSYLIESHIKPDSRTKLDINDVISPYICNVKNLDLLPGDIELYDEYLVSEMLHYQAVKEGKATEFDQVWNTFERSLIRNILAPIQDKYDFIIMDCAPGYNLLTRSGISASDYYILPARPEPLSVIGIQLLERRINQLKENHKDSDPINLKLLGIVFILSAGGFLGRYYNQVMERVKQDFKPTELFKNKIPMDVSLAKALDKFMPAVLSDPNSTGSKAFAQLTKEFLEKISSFGAVQKTDGSKVNLQRLE